jgi:hypothetical protein
MATTSRQTTIFGIQDWKQLYQTFSEANFQSYDYETLRKAFVDYLQTYYPETFNDYTESSEFVALLDVIAFMGQALAFRNDLNTRENFIDTAERRDSVTKLANLVGYTAKRNITGQGYIKVSSISTTEGVYDINGNNLANQTILWNDPANAFWQEQFNAIINAALVSSQRIGRPGNSGTILGVQTDEYTLAQPSGYLSVLPYATVVDGINMNFELVSVSSKGSATIYEVPPNTQGFFNLLYRNDNLGYGSANTGYFFYFKQGSLTASEFALNQKIPNWVQNIDIQGINNSDTWLFQLNSSGTLVSKEWLKVENVYNNASLNTESSNRDIFSVVSRFNDQVGYVFGDGIVSSIPTGNFRAYVRAGNALQYTIDPEEMQGISVVFSYISRSGKTESMTFTLDLQQPVNTAQTRESLTAIKERAPLRYYSQNRMVNGEDYTSFPYTLYSSIIKSQAINRTSIGVSRNLDLLDPTNKYSSNNSFGTDGAIWQVNTPKTTVETFITSSDSTKFLTGELRTILSAYSSIQYYQENYPRYSSTYIVTLSPFVTSNVYWKQATVNTNSTTGYFYIINNGLEIPINVGVAGGGSDQGNTQFLTVGSLIKILPPAGKFFDQNNRIVSTSSVTTKTYLWIQILNVVGNGSNSGKGVFADGSGPVTINNFLPSTCFIDNTDSIIPAFDNVLSTTVTERATSFINLGYNFVLYFDNSIPITQERWTIEQYTGAAPNNDDWFVDFKSQGLGRYIIYVKSLSYFWGSVEDTRFLFDVDKRVFDPKSGRVSQDYITILSTNTLPVPPNSPNLPLNNNLRVNIVGQLVQSDGYADDYAVEISGTDVDVDGIVDDPDFFNYVVGTPDNTQPFVFFERFIDGNDLERYLLIYTSIVNYQYNSYSAIDSVKYQYPVGQVFYANNPPLESQRPDQLNPNNSFFITQIQAGTVNTIEVISTTDYLAAVGRQGLAFQYRHISPNTTRIDPGTTNIIDLYVVTQSYYTAYTNWIQDTTDTVLKPNKPTISELSQLYQAGINNYKMISDTAVLNSVDFKPLFGKKAAPQFQATIKVIKNINTVASDNEIRTAVVAAMNNYFSIDNWNFGDTFYFSELSAYLHNQVGDLISSAVLVSNNPDQPFGDLYEIRSAPYEIFVNGALPTDVQVITALTPEQLQFK